MKSKWIFPLCLVAAVFTLGAVKYYTESFYLLTANDDVHVKVRSYGSQTKPWLEFVQNDTLVFAVPASGILPVEYGGTGTTTGGGGGTAGALTNNEARDATFQRSVMASNLTGSAFGLSNVVASLPFTIPTRLVVFGDSISITNAWPHFLTNNYSEFRYYPIYNYSLSGDNGSNAFYGRYTNSVQPHAPSGGTNAVLAVWFGANDIGAFSAANLITYNSNLLYAAKRDGFQVLAFTTMAQSPTSAGETIRHSWNYWLRKNANLWDWMVDADRVMPDPADTIWFSDGTHPTDAGRARLAAAVRNAFYTAPGTPAEVVSDIMFPPNGGAIRASTYGYPVLKFLPGVNEGTTYFGYNAGFGYLGWDTALAVIGGQTGNALALAANNQEKMRIETGGDVGIGTNDPSARLHVVGDVIISGAVTLGGTLEGDTISSTTLEISGPSNGGQFTNLMTTNLVAGAVQPWTGPTNSIALGQYCPGYYYTLTNNAAVTNLTGLLSPGEWSASLLLTNGTSSNVTFSVSSAAIRTLGGMTNTVITIPAGLTCDVALAQQTNGFSVSRVVAILSNN